MISFHSVVFTLVLFSVCLAAPMAKLDDGRTDQENLNLILGDRLTNEAALHVPVFRQSPVPDSATGEDEDGAPKIIILSDIGQKRHSRRGLNPAFAQGPLLTDRSADHTPVEHLKIERREADLDMLRCMIGRVYRPCWQT